MSLRLPPPPASSKESSEFRLLTGRCLVVEGPRPLGLQTGSEDATNISNCLSAFSSCSRCMRSNSRMRISRASARACLLAHSLASAWKIQINCPSLYKIKGKEIEAFNPLLYYSFVWFETNLNNRFCHTKHKKNIQKILRYCLRKQIDIFSDVPYLEQSEFEDI